MQILGEWYRRGSQNDIQTLTAVRHLAEALLQIARRVRSTQFSINPDFVFLWLFFCF